MLSIGSKRCPSHATWLWGGLATALLHWRCHEDNRACTGARITRGARVDKSRGAMERTVVVSIGAVELQRLAVVSDLCLGDVPPVRLPKVMWKGRLDSGALAEAR